MFVQVESCPLQGSKTGRASHSATRGVQRDGALADAVPAQGQSAQIQSDLLPAVALLRLEEGQAQ